MKFAYDLTTFYKFFMKGPSRDNFSQFQNIVANFSHINFKIYLDIVTLNDIFPNRDWVNMQEMWPFRPGCAEIAKYKVLLDSNFIIQEKNRMWNSH